MNSQNIDRLTAEQQCLLALIMVSPNWLWPVSYMVEVRLDDATRNLLHGDRDDTPFANRCLHVHAGGGTRCYTTHADDPDWAIVHIDDEEVQDWDWQAMAARGRELAAAALAGEAGEQR